MWRRNSQEKVRGSKSSAVTVVRRAILSLHAGPSMGKLKFAPGSNTKDSVCWHCGEKGHISQNCSNVKKSDKSDEEDIQEKLNKP